MLYFCNSQFRRSSEKLFFRRPFCVRDIPKCGQLYLNSIGQNIALQLSVDLSAVDREEVGAEPPFVYRLIIDIGVRFG